MVELNLWSPTLSSSGRLATNNSSLSRSSSTSFHSPTAPLSPFAEESDPFLAPASPSTPTSPRPLLDRSYRPRSRHETIPGGVESSRLPRGKMVALSRHALARFFINQRGKLLLLVLLFFGTIALLSVATSSSASSLSRFREYSGDAWTWMAIVEHTEGGVTDDSVGVEFDRVTGNEIDVEDPNGSEAEENAFPPLLDSNKAPSAESRPSTDRNEPNEAIEPVVAASKITATRIDPSLPMDQTVPINVRPPASSPPDEEERFIGYLPHSGFHNQRIELQNAMMLGRALNRTVLIPPVWIGWPTPTRHYEELAASWTTAMLLNPSTFGIDTLTPDSKLNQPVNYSSSVEEYPFPTSQADDPIRIAHKAENAAKAADRWRSMGYEVRLDGFPITNLTAKDCKSYSPECRHTYEDSFLAWSSLVDFSALKGLVKIRDRWDMRERAIEGLLGVEPKDIYVLKDRQSYDLKFVEAWHSDGRLIHFDTNEANHWARRVSIPRLRRRPERVLLVGSLFGSGRVSLRNTRAMLNYEDKFARAMAFRTPELIVPADEIRDRLGGAGAYIGAHARVGDGEFAWRAKTNMQDLRRRVVESLDMESDQIDKLWNVVKPQQRDVVGPGFTRERRGHDNLFKEAVLGLISPDSQRSITHERHRRMFIPRADHQLDRLKCRAPLHTLPNLLRLNVPLYLATDSRLPLSDPYLAPFFRTFPCTFILSDFDHPNELNFDEPVKGVDRMMRLITEADGVALGRLFLPFLEATIAAKAGVTIGTKGSTFSSFAESSLHDAYAADA